MPRKQSLSLIVPNRYYDLQATVVCYHRTENGATAIIEQDQVQKKIILPSGSAALDQGVQYHFPKCFYSRNGWIKVKQSTSIEQIKSEQIVSLTLEQINQRKDTLVNNYITTSLQLVEIKETEKKQKNGTELSLTIMKGFSQNLIIDITVWNQQISKEYLNKTALLEGFRVKMLTKDTFVLVSTVYSKISLVHNQMEQNQYDSQKRYRSLSQVYSQKNIAQMRESLKELTKCFSIIQAKITEATAFDYQGCKKCHKKLESNMCSFCKEEAQKQLFWVCQLQIEDNSGNCTLYVFDAAIQGALKMVKKNSIIKAKIRSTIRLDSTGDNNIESHTLVGIKSITF